MDKHKRYILHAIKSIGAMTPDQIARVLFDGAIAEKFDLMPALSQLKEDGLLEQGVSQNGIIYLLTREGDKMLAGRLSAIPDDERQQFDEKCAEYCGLFDREKDYIAQYTEQANALVPVFLSIREKDKILLQVSVIVNDTATAKQITKNWMRNAHKTFDAVWESIADGMTKPNIQ